MRDQSSQPSSIVFPIALEPETDETEQVGEWKEPWGWLEVFVLVQVLWAVLLFVPGTQAYRIYIRALPYVASLVALIACSRAGGPDGGVPGARWIVAALAVLVASLVHPATWLMSGTAQVVFQLSIAAPAFWAARVWLSRERLERLLILVFGANFLSATLGLLQVYYPETFMPPEFSSMALRMNEHLVGAMSYVGTDGRLIVRPPGLSDLPGGAAVAGTITALLGFAFAVRSNQTRRQTLWYAGAAVAGITVVYLTQVRAMLVMVVICMMTTALVRLRQGRVIQSAWIVSSAAVLVVGAFLWAVTVGGESVQERFQGIVDTGVVQAYQEHRGLFLAYTVQELLFEYPFGAGMGRWGMMSAYFGEPENWQFPALHAELQLTGWLFDGGVLMWLFYGGAVLMAIHYSYRVASDQENVLHDLATIVLSLQVLVLGLCFTGPVFNTQVGILFWLLTALLYGAQRTIRTEEQLLLEEESS